MLTTLLELYVTESLRSHCRQIKEAQKIAFLKDKRVVFIGTDAWVIPSFVELSDGLGKHSGFL